MTGICPECNRRQVINNDGNIQKHLKAGQRTNCPGTAKKAVTEYSQQDKATRGPWWHRRNW